MSLFLRKYLFGLLGAFGNSLDKAFGYREGKLDRSDDSMGVFGDIRHKCLDRLESSADIGHGRILA
jgi:hypothetical protein